MQRTYLRPLPNPLDQVKEQLRNTEDALEKSIKRLKEKDRLIEQLQGMLGDKL
jgi:hypothetical protein